MADINSYTAPKTLEEPCHKSDPNEREKSNTHSIWLRFRSNGAAGKRVKPRNYIGFGPPEPK
ncbi:hypothetical protein Dda_4389 [Drechslerella dactyloides]|uniref:Uncharacterized protein n=1 Tax=Drechslerella dactyloides TaxID=74499 RepID=A0AAD6IX80_DREDA|nr:hypothetical protein Dda_4389 [Drechslerella dactyloides]